MFCEQNLLYCIRHCEKAFLLTDPRRLQRDIIASRLREGDASEIKHIAHGEGMTFKCVDDKFAKTVKGLAVTALHV